MYIHGKADWIGNIIYNLILAVLLAAVAEILNSGGIMWPAIAIETVIGFILEMLIVMFLPFVNIAFKTANKHAQPGTAKFKAIMATIAAIPFAIIMSCLMSLYSVIIVLHLPAVVWLTGWLRVMPVFIVLAWLCAFFMLPPIMAWANRKYGNHGGVPAN